MLRGAKHQARRSRRTNPFSQGILPPRAENVMRAHFPENDPYLQDLIDRGEMTTEEVAAVGEIRSRETMFQKRTRSIHERTQNIETERLKKTAREKVEQKTPPGRRRSQYTGRLATHAEKFESKMTEVDERTIPIIASKDSLLITDDESIQEMLDELQNPDDTMASVDVSIEKIEPEPEPIEKPIKSGPLSAMRREWNNEEYDEYPEEESGQEAHQEQSSSEPIQALEETLVVESSEPMDLIEESLLEGKLEPEPVSVVHEPVIRPAAKKKTPRKAVKKTNSKKKAAKSKKGTSKKVSKKKKA